jgi:hypothetical protein
VTNPMKSRLVLRRQVLQPLTDAQLVSIEGGRIPVAQTDSCTGQGCNKTPTEVCSEDCLLSDKCTVDCTSGPP